MGAACKYNRGVCGFNRTVNRCGGGCFTDTGCMVDPAGGAEG